MSDLKLVLEILSRIEEAAKRVTRRFAKVDSSDAFLESEEGLEKLDAICMQLITIGESLKNLDKATSRELLPKYPQVEWRVPWESGILSHTTISIWMPKQSTMPVNRTFLF